VRHLHIHGGRSDHQRLLLGGKGLLGGHIARQIESVQHDLLAFLGLFRGCQGSEGRVLGQRHEHRGLGQGQVTGRLAKVGLRGGLDAIGHVPVKDGVEIGLHDAVAAFAARVLPHELDREHHLLDLADVTALGAFLQGLK